MFDFFKRGRLIRRGLASRKMRRRRGRSELKRNLEYSPFIKVVIFAVFVGGLAFLVFSGQQPEPTKNFVIALLVLATLAIFTAPQLFFGLAIGAWTIILLLGASLFLTYGVVTLGAIVLAIAVYRRALRPLLMAGGGVLAVVLAFLAGGFWWYDGLQAARELQLAGVYQRRPYAEFLVNSPAAQNSSITLAF